MISNYTKRKNNIVKSLKKNGDVQFYNVLDKELRDCKSVLDLGCGKESPIIRTKRKFYSVGVDSYSKSINISKKNKIHNSYKVMDLNNIGGKFKDKSFDAVILLDVVEHFTKAEAIKLIKNSENIAKKKVVIMTPNGFHHQEALEGNPHQIHKSGWKLEDFTKRNYKVYGLRGYKKLRGEHANIKLKPWILGGTLAYITEKLLYRVPSLSFDLFAIRYAENK